MRGIILFLNGTHYTNANITDEKSLEILTKFPVKINAFVRFPKNWKELTKGTKTEALKTEESKELEGLSDEDLRTLCDKLAEQTEGLRKLNHKAGKDKMIDYLLKNKVNG